MTVAAGHAAVWDGPVHFAALRFQRSLAVVLVLSLALPLPAQLGREITVFPFSLVLVPLLLLWGLEAALRPVQRPVGRRRGVDPVLVAIGSCCIAMIASNVLNHADWRHVSLWFWGFLLFAVARYRLPELLRRDELARVLVALVAFLAVIAAVQVVTGRPIGALAQYFDKGVRSALVYEGLGGGALFKRVQGTFFSVDIFAMFISYVLFALLALGRTLRSRSVTAASIACFGMIAFTFSRGVWFATACSVPLLLAWFARNRWIAASRVLAAGFAISAVVLLVAITAPATVFARFESEQLGQSVSVRTHALEVGVDVIATRPVFGVGYMNFVDASNELGLNPLGNDIRPHNTFIQVWAEQGVVVLVLFLSIPFLLVTEARRQLRRSDQAARAMAGGVVASVGAWVVFMFVYAQANEYSVVPALLCLTGYALTLLDTTPRGRGSSLDADVRSPSARVRERVS